MSAQHSKKVTKPTITVITGPTASGKTAAGIAVAQKSNGAVLSADSRQTYIGMDIGSAKPFLAPDATAHSPLTADTVENVPHYLFNIAAPDTELSLAEWQRAALSCLEYLVAHDQPPIVVGGTMLYISSLIEHYTLPPVAPDRDIRDGLAQLTNEQLYAKLQRSDPEATAFIEPHHTQRMIRALEVIQLTGEKFSTLRQAGESPYTFDVHAIAPDPEVRALAIAERAEQMIADGLLTETERLQLKWGDALLQKTTNYKQALAVLAGASSQEEMLADMLRADKRYSKRQLAWWRPKPNITWHTNAASVIAALT